MVVQNAAVSPTGVAMSMALINARAKTGFRQRCEEPAAALSLAFGDPQFACREPDSRPSDNRDRLARSDRKPGTERRAQHATQHRPHLDDARRQHSARRTAWDHADRAGAG